MASNMKKQKEEWQVAILRQRYEAGMTRTSKAHASELKAASTETNLPLQVVKDWVLNQQRPNRSRKGTSSNVNIYTAFAKTFKPDHALPLGEMTKERAKVYREKVATAEGQAELQAGLAACKAQAAAVETPLQQQNAVNKEFMILESSMERLRSRGIMANCIVARPNKKPLVIGCEQGAHFLANHESILNRFAETALSPFGTDPAEDKRQVLRSKVQSLLNEKYHEVSRSKVVPYREIENGTHPFKVINLPVTLKKPSNYKMDELVAILEASAAIRFVSSTQEEPATNEEHHSSEAMEQGGEEVTEQVDEQVDEQEEVQMEENDSSLALGEIEALFVEESASLDEDLDEDHDEDDVISLKNVKSAKEAIKDIKRKYEERSSRKGTQKRKFQVEMLWTLDDESRQWYKGTAKKIKGGSLSVDWEDGETSTVSKKDLIKLEAEKHFRYVQS